MFVNFTRDFPISNDAIMHRRRWNNLKAMGYIMPIHETKQYCTVKNQCVLTHLPSCGTYGQPYLQCYSLSPWITGWWQGCPLWPRGGFSNYVGKIKTIQWLDSWMFIIVIEWMWWSFQHRWQSPTDQLQTIVVYFVNYTFWRFGVCIHNRSRENPRTQWPS